MNEGIKRASGIFIMILNSDDILNSNTIIEETVKKIKRIRDMMFSRKCYLFLI